MGGLGSHMRSLCRTTHRYASLYMGDSDKVRTRVLGYGEGCVPNLEVIDVEQTAGGIIEDAAGWKVSNDAYLYYDNNVF